MGDSITCTACRISITGRECRRSHYRSDLHRVNLKRKVTGLGPLTQDELYGRIQALQDEGKQAEKGKQFCECCNKKFSSKKALENHMKSKRHRDGLMRMEMSFVDSDSFVDADDSGVEEVVEEEGNDEDVDRELEERLRGWGGDDGMFSGVFDDSWHEESYKAYQHTREKYGFFVPYEEFLRDWDGLMRYVGQKVGIGYACICCDKGFGSVDAVRKHMKDVGHCRMCEDWVSEFSEFYEWADEEEEEGWEEVNDGDVVGDDVEEVEEEEGLDMVGRLDDGGSDDVGLVVHGKKVVGHRSLNRYYRQASGRKDDLRVAVVANRGNGRQVALVGWKSRDKVAVKDERNAVRRRQRFELLVGGKNYYTRKARFKQKMAVFNSGYRA